MFVRAQGAGSDRRCWSSHRVSKEMRNIGNSVPFSEREKLFFACIKNCVTACFDKDVASRAWHDICQGGAEPVGGQSHTDERNAKVETAPSNFKKCPRSDNWRVPPSEFTIAVAISGFGLAASTFTCASPLSKNASRNPGEKSTSVGFRDKRKPKCLNELAAHARRIHKNVIRKEYDALGLRKKKKRFVPAKISCVISAQIPEVTKSGNITEFISLFVHTCIKPECD